MTSILSITPRISLLQPRHDHRLPSASVPTALSSTQYSAQHYVPLVCRIFAPMQQPGPPARTVRSRCAFFPMATSQDERVSSEGPPSCTPLSRGSLMECEIVEPLGCVPSAVVENLSNQHENVSSVVVVHGEKSNKAMQLSDVTKVGSEEMELGDEVTYAKKVGFATKIRTTTYDKITKIPVNQAIHCNRNGFRGSRVSAPTRKNTISVAGCKAMIYVKFDKDMEMMSYFIRMKDINPNFFYAVKLDEECKFRSAVWVDARCRASYEYYGDVVAVDSNYSTNRHGLLFVSFVGVNHHGKSIILGYALLGNEEIPSYEWIFSQWVKCIETASQCIITDQCRSIFRAIRYTLPDTHYWWCIWHITKKLPPKLGGYRWYRDLYDDLNDIVWNSWTEESFEDNWSEFIGVQLT
ncbi:hypothetical protein Ahy_B07g086696 [Arachis hypogaea]|uniref:Uncharacterized protein n=1 Tax=Arachis hypogaea TaxID=3818 RepID=A0A444YAA5_ARAHY|nr:hypothetical protein Ahy_B07g086696 [Arachis hypogaea]